MKNLLISAVATILVPGVAVLLVPYWILQATGRLTAPPVGFLEGLAIALGLIGVAMVIWVSAAYVRRGKGTPVPTGPPEILVVERLDRPVRNPMFLGALPVLAAEALLFRSAWVLLDAGFLGLALHPFAVFIEEPQLEQRFRPGVSASRDGRPRWSPGRRAS